MPETYPFAAYIYSASGNRPVGMPLYASAPTTVENMSSGIVSFDASHSCVNLAQGGQYIIFLSTSGLWPDGVVDDILSVSYASFAPNPTGGLARIGNPGNSTSDFTASTTTWIGPAPGVEFRVFVTYS